MKSSEQHIPRESLVRGNIYVGISPLTRDEFIIMYTGDLSCCTFIKDGKLFKKQACCTASYAKFRNATKTEAAYLRKALTIKTRRKDVTFLYEDKEDEQVDTYSII